MRAKLTPEICYIAGMLSKTRQGERSMVGINTTIDGVIENFVSFALKLGVDTKKIMIEDEEGVKHVYFYHSKLARQAREIIEKETRLFKFKNELSSSFIAGMFDASGNVGRERVFIKNLTKHDQLVLQNLGVHTDGYSIRNIKSFFALISAYSIILQQKLDRKQRYG